jgi:beta-galactosidase
MKDHGTQYSYTQTEGSTVVQFSNGVLIYLLDQKSAWKFFAPPTTLNPAVRPDEHIFVLGPYLVRGASIDHDVVDITGDNDNSTSLEFVVPAHIIFVLSNKLTLC